MMKTFQEYAKTHNLKFSTHVEPAKSKTKCLAFLKHDRPLKKILLDGNELPWWDSGKHVGNNIENAIDGLQKDIRIKRARFIQKNCEINQEFHFCHPSSKLQLNQIYNSSFTGSPLWDLFSKSSENLEKTYNTSVRLMYDLPRESHCYLIEPVSGNPHLKFVLLKRFLKFREQVFSCSKTTMKSMFEICQHDARSVTGSNFRKLMLLCEKNSINEISSHDIDGLVYRQIPTTEEWRIGLVNDLIEIKRDNEVLLPGFTLEEIDEMLHFACVT